MRSSFNAITRPHIQDLAVNMGAMPTLACACLGTVHGIVRLTLQQDARAEQELHPAARLRFIGRTRQVGYNSAVITISSRARRPQNGTEPPLMNRISFLAGVAAALLNLIIFPEPAPLTRQSPLRSAAPSSLDAPGAWQSKQPRTRIVEHEFAVPAAKGDELTVA